MWLIAQPERSLSVNLMTECNLLFKLLIDDEYRGFLATTTIEK